MQFDDLKITHTKTNVIQYNEYYPFGLQTGNSWTRDNSRNNFLYNGGTELNTASGYYDLFYRNYDPATGRFVQVDPMSASEMATYQYSGNNPVMFNDPMGDQKNWKRIQAEGAASEFFRESTRYGGGGGYSSHFDTESWADHDMQLLKSALEHGMPWAQEAAGSVNIYSAGDLGEGEHLAIVDGKLVIRCEACGEYAGSSEDGSRQYFYNTYRELPGLFALQGGVYTINQVLGQYGYPSREEYLFPKPTFVERLLNFGVPLDQEDLAEKVIEAVSNEWDLIHQNLDAVGLTD